MTMAEDQEPNDQHREHLRRLRAELAFTAVIIKHGAAAITGSVELLNRLDGRTMAQADGSAEGC